MIVAANLKTNLTRKATREYLQSLQNCIAKKELKAAEVFVFPATSSLDCFDGDITVGAQNAYPVKNGAFTGEIGLEHLEEFGINTILIGHSERRHILGETQEIVVKKFEYFKSLGFKIVYCVGEPLDVRNEGLEATLAYIQTQLEGIDTTYEKLIVAYEPVWAIGTGLTPTKEDITQIHVALKAEFDAPLLYGGSVKCNNVEDILSIESVDGVLVGSGALDVEDFCTMVASANRLNS